jgi:large conductance mechanosensitive channel
MRTASASSANGMIAATGPNTSSRAMRSSLVASTRSSTKASYAARSTRMRERSRVDAAGDRDRLSVVLVDRARVEVEHLSHRRDLAAGAADRLPDVLPLDARELLRVLLDEGREPPQQAPAIGRRDRALPRERGLRPGYGGIRLLHPRRLQLREHLLGRGVENRRGHGDDSTPINGKGQVVKDFRAFLLRGNLVDTAVGIVIGLAFAAVVTALVADIITPIIAAIFGQPDFSNLTFTIHKSRFLYGSFVNAVVSFVLIAAAVFYIVVKPVNAIRQRRKAEEEATTRECPECLSEIPIAARRCSFCTAEVGAAGA